VLDAGFQQVNGSELAGVHDHLFTGDGDKPAKLLPRPFRGVYNIASGIRGEGFVAVIELDGTVGAVNQRLKDRAATLGDFTNLALAFHAGKQGIVVGNGVRKFLGTIAKGGCDQNADISGHCEIPLSDGVS